MSEKFDISVKNSVFFSVSNVGNPIVLAMLFFPSKEQCRRVKDSEVRARR